MATEEETQVELEETGCARFRARNKKKRWYIICATVIKLLIHFGIVCLFMAGGTIGFVYLEDPELSKEEEEYLQTTINETIFRENIVTKYNLNLTNELFTALQSEFTNHSHQVAEHTAKVARLQERQNRNYIYDKWFYFTNIMSTTIGYGDVYPVTDGGKLLFIGFSIPAIPVMITLLTRIGNIMTNVNTFIFKMCIQKLCKLDNNKHISNEFLSALTIILMLLGYISAGAFINMVEEKWSYLDSIYFWFVTFTTVGFGDITQEIGPMQAYLLVYRLFGLALLAGVVDSLTAWVAVRREALKRLELKKLDARRGIGGLGKSIKRLSQDSKPGQVASHPELRQTWSKVGTKHPDVPEWFTNPTKAPPKIPRASIQGPHESKPSTQSSTRTSFDDVAPSDKQPLRRPMTMLVGVPRTKTRNKVGVDNKACLD